MVPCCLPKNRFFFFLVHHPSCNGDLLILTLFLRATIVLSYAFHVSASNCFYLMSLVFCQIDVLKAEELKKSSAILDEVKDLSQRTEETLAVLEAARIAEEVRGAAGVLFSCMAVVVWP